MTNAAQAYKKVEKTIANPRAVEANLLLHAASRLQAIKDSWEGKTPEFDDALLYNRRLWTVFLSSVTRPDNPLPAGIRQNVANLGLFMLKNTMLILLDPRPEKLDSLIGINQALAAGLTEKAA